MKKLPNERVAVCVQLDKPTHAMLKALVGYFNDTTETQYYNASSWLRDMIQDRYRYFKLDGIEKASEK